MRGVSGSVVPVTADFSFKLTLSDPCPLTNLVSLREYPFVDMQYILGRESVYQPFDHSNIVTHDN